MTAIFHDIVNELREEVFGAQWLFIKPHVSRWIATNPEKVLWLTNRIRRKMQEGKL